MQSCIKLLTLVCLVSLVFVGFAQWAAAAPQGSASAIQAEQGSIPAFPYIAEITGDDVHIRSGPGTNYYSCGRLNGADRVKVVASQFSWSHIVPPAGSFSWISKQYVSIDPNNPSVGTVTGDAVRVYAGSEELKPIHSTTLQLKLSRSDKVKLTGTEQGDYYKIAPPAGAYLWVSTQYTRPLGPASEVPPVAEQKAEPEPAAPAPAVAVVKYSTDTAIEAVTLNEYYALQKQFEAERAKPMAEQNYTNIKNAFVKIAGNKVAGKAARYAEFGIRQIERCELALEVAKELPAQNSHLQQVQKRIEKARAAKLAQLRDLGKFAVIGQFESSNIYSPQPAPKHYRITDDAGKIVCYALASGLSEEDLNEFLGKKVGLVGTIEPHPETAGAIVRFTEIEELE